MKTVNLLLLAFALSLSVYGGKDTSGCEDPFISVADAFYLHIYKPSKDAAFPDRLLISKTNIPPHVDVGFVKATIVKGRKKALNLYKGSYLAAESMLPRIIYYSAKNAAKKRWVRTEIKPICDTTQFEEGFELEPIYDEKSIRISSWRIYKDKTFLTLATLEEGPKDISITLGNADNPVGTKPKGAAYWQLSIEDKRIGPALLSYLVGMYEWQNYQYTAQPSRLPAWAWAGLGGLVTGWVTLGVPAALYAWLRYRGCCGSRFAYQKLPRHMN